MLSLDSPRWAELDHAYGKADDVPEMLRQLEAFLRSDGSDPWDSIWSALSHQSDVYFASFAAMPHILRILGYDLARGNSAFLLFPAWIEICRQKKPVEIPADLEATYFEALSRLPAIATASLAVDRDEEFIRCAVCAVAAGKGQTALAEAALELSPDVVNDFWAWYYER